MGCRDQLDATLLQLGAESGDLLVLELVLVDIGLEGLFLELAQLLSLVEEGAGFQFSKLGQFSSLLLLLQRTGAYLAPHLLERSAAALYSYYRRTCRDFWWVRIFLFTRCSALSIVFVSQPSSSAICSYDEPSR
jgi:hypothetical protein